MAQSRSAQLQHLADLTLEKLELLEAPAARLAGSSRSFSPEQIRGMRRQAAMLRASAAAIEPRFAPLEVYEGADKTLGELLGDRGAALRAH